LLIGKSDVCTLNNRAGPVGQNTANGAELGLADKHGWTGNDGAISNQPARIR
jgi:hypothetical protein